MDNITERSVLLNIERTFIDISLDEPIVQPSIFRVPAHIRRYKNNERYFEPRVVSIGPYHRNKDHLRAMEMHKWRYFHDFLAGGRSGREEYVSKITALVPSVRKCYFESVNDIKDEQFVEMLLLDGCFIMQLLIKLNGSQNSQDNIDPVFTVAWNLPLISTDLLMLENQIPFSVLKVLYDVYYYEAPSKPSLDNILLNFVICAEHRRREEISRNFTKWLKRTPATQPCVYHHLLHFYYIANIPDPNTATSPNNANFFSKALSCLSLMSLCPRRETRGSETAEPSDRSANPYPRMILCATELKEFGIKFKKHKQPENFMDISFIGGVLMIPCISVEEATKPKFMNLVTFEQSVGLDNKHMTSYVRFMDFLLNTRKDVIILQKKDIIENKLANEDDVAEFFSQLNACCYMKFDEHFLAPVFRELKAYCEKRWPKYRAKFCRDYFSNPWAIFSLGAAVFVLLVTIFRTICYIIALKRHHIS